MTNYIVDQSRNLTIAVGESLDGFDVRLSAADVVLQISGSQDWSAVHYDLEYAKNSGHEKTFFNTGWTQGLLTRLVTDWMGELGWLKKLAFQMRKMNSPGDLIKVRGRVRSVDDGSARVTAELDIWIENTRQGVTATGSATVSWSK
jgi:acyl dehydratase